MPFMSDQDLGIIKSNLHTRDNKIAKLNDNCRTAKITNKVMTIGEGIAGAAAVGYARGKFEDKGTGQWNLPGTEIDLEMLVVVGLAGVALAGEAVGLKKMQTHAANLCAGIGGHYAGQVARKMASTGTFSMIAGDTVGELPQYDPHSYQPTQYAAPYDDAVASALSASGV